MAREKGLLQIFCFCNSPFFIMYRIVAQSFRITQNDKQNKKMNNFTRGISTDGSGAFALLGV